MENPEKICLIFSLRGRSEKIAFVKTTFSDLYIVIIESG